MSNVIKKIVRFVLAVPSFPVAMFVVLVGLAVNLFAEFLEDDSDYWHTKMYIDDVKSLWNWKWLRFK